MRMTPSGPTPPDLVQASAATRADAGDDPSSPPPSPSATPPRRVLGYGRAPSRAWQWGRRLLILAWLAGTGWLAYDKWGVLVRLQAAVVYHQYRCLTYAVPPDRVVIELDPARVPSLLAQPGYRRGTISGRNGGWSARPAAIYDPPGKPLTSYSEAVGLRAEYELLRNPPPPADAGDIPDFSNAPDLAPADDPALSEPLPPDGRDQTAFPVLLSGPAVDDTAGVFLHGRRAGTGPTRLVIVAASWYAESGDLVVQASVEGLSYTGTTRDDVPEAPGFERGSPRFSVRSADGQNAVRLFAGQPDPADEARFTIRFETATGGGTIVGRLDPDGGVRLDLDAGPSVDPSQLPVPAPVPPDAGGPS
jgi:hypothetical protein